MVLRLGQLIHTNFDKAGFSTLKSAEVPLSIQKAFIARIVYQYWNVRSQSSGYQAVYLHQVSSREFLFGWLYNDEAGDLGQGYAPYFVCYYWVGILTPRQLEALLACLRIGPVALLDRHSLPDTIDAVVIPDPYRYRSARPGIAIPPEVQEQSDRLLAEGEELKLLVAIDPATAENPKKLLASSSSSALRAMGREAELKRFEQRFESPEQHSVEQSSPSLIESLDRSDEWVEDISSLPAQAPLTRSSRITVLRVFLLLAVIVSSFFVLRLFADAIGGKLIPREKLAPSEKLAPRQKLSLLPSTATASTSQPLGFKFESSSRQTHPLNWGDLS